MKSDHVKNLRKNLTTAERLIWKHLRSRQFEGLKFRRQEPIGNYIVDFVCFEKNIIVKIDGGQHAEQKMQDAERDKWFQSRGFTTLRFWNNDVLKNIEGVIETIRKNLDTLTPRPLP